MCILTAFDFNAIGQDAPPFNQGYLQVNISSSGSCPLANNLTVWYSAKYERKGFTSTFEDEAVRLWHVQIAPTPFILDLCLKAHLCPMYMQCTLWPAEGVRSFGSGVTGVYESPCVYWELNPGPLEQQSELITAVGYPSSPPTLLLIS